MKWALLILMSVTILTMLSFPGCYDSKRRMVAHSRYYGSPSDAIRKELQEAKGADWGDIAIYEAVLVGLLGLTLFVYLRVEKGAEKNEK
jgi:hypothetical protein